MGAHLPERGGGFLNNSSRGVWSLSAAGLEATEVDPRYVIRNYPRASKRDDSTTNVEDPDHLEDDSPEDFPEEDSTWQEQLIETLLNIKPDSFERLCQLMLRESGFIEVRVTGSSGDGGIDGYGTIRLGGLISFPVAFQCKRWRNSVGAKEVRDLRGAMVGRADKGLLITTSTFTRDARQEARRDGAPPIDLIDWQLLCDKLKELNLGVSSVPVEIIQVDQEYFKNV